MASLVVWLTLLILTACVPTFSSRALLNIFQNDDCETQFDSDNIRGHLDPGEGRFHCFRNHVSCVDYDLHVLGAQFEDRPQVLVVVAETGAVTDAQQNSLDSYIEGSVCVGSDCSQRIDVDDSKHYSVIVLNSDFEDPLFENASGEDVNYELDLYGCPTVTQRLVIVFIVVAFLFAICGCISCCVVYFRRTSRLEAMKQEEANHVYNSDMAKSTQMTQQASSVGDSSSTVPLQPQPVHIAQPSLSESVQSAIPWATPVTSPSSTATATPMLPRF